MIIYDNFPKTALESLTHDLSFEIPELDMDAAIHYLRRAAIMMCRESDLVVHTATIHTQPGVVAYLLEPADDTEVVALMGVQTRGVYPPPQRLTHAPDDSVLGPAVWFDKPNIIHIRERVTRGRNYEIEFSTAPSRDACSVDSSLAGEYYETLLAGARYLAFDVAGKPWSDPARGAAYRAAYVMGMRENKIDQMTGHQRGVMRARYPRVM